MGSDFARVRAEYHDGSRLFTDSLPRLRGNWHQSRKRPEDFLSSL